MSPNCSHELMERDPHAKHQTLEEYVDHRETLSLNGSLGRHVTGLPRASGSMHAKIDRR